MRYLLILLLIPSIALAQVKHLNKNDKAPFSGYLFSPDKEAEVRKTNEDYKTLVLVDQNNQKLFKLKDDQIGIMDKQITLWRTQSQDLSKQLVERENSSFWKQTLFFGLGAIVTTAIVYGVNKASK